MIVMSIILIIMIIIMIIKISIIIIIIIIIKLIIRVINQQKQWHKQHNYIQIHQTNKDKKNNNNKRTHHFFSKFPLYTYIRILHNRTLMMNFQRRSNNAPFERTVRTDSRKGTGRQGGEETKKLIKLPWIQNQFFNVETEGSRKDQSKKQ